MDINWHGPFSWPGFESLNGLESIPNYPGVYLWTVECQGGFLVYSAGITKNPKARFQAHTLAYRKGNYNTLDLEKAQIGIREIIWNWTPPKKWTPEKISDFQEKNISLQINQLLAGFRVFLAPVESPRLRARLEASIILGLYRSEPPYCNLPDKGMHLEPKWRNEKTILVRNIFSAKIWIPSEILI